ncbi:MAG TPA: tetratricopeptide repeat protein [Blastocatellia bacterium]|nr:tetratricopeptide repeat protein [Blastocatellia bacterium]
MRFSWDFLGDTPMDANGHAKRLFRFGQFLLDPAERQLRAAGAVVPLTSKVFDTLLVLVEQRGHLVEKDELMRRLWPDSFVEEVTLAHNISDLRKALGNEGRKYIETVSKRGYRFVADVSEVADETPIEAEANPSLTPPNEAVAPAGKGKRKAVWLTAGLALAGLVVLLAFLWPVRNSEPPAAGLKLKTLAVLPFRPLHDANNDEYLGLGLADTLITKLSNVRQLIVRPTSAVQKYAAAGFNAQTIGQEQMVEAVLEGSVQKLGDKVRVSVRLLAARDGAPLWAYQCEEYCTDIFAMQNAVSEQVAMALLARLTGEEKRVLTKRETGSTEAYQLYLQGRHFWNRRTAEGLKKSIEYFEQAIAKDPRYARAYAGLSDAWGLLWGYGFVPPAEAIPQARTAAQKALALDETLAEAHHALGAIAWNYDWDWAGAEREFRRAIALNPHYAPAHHYLGEFLTYLGRFDEGQAEFQRALEIDPTSLVIHTDAGLMLAITKQYDEGIAHYRKALELDPNFRKARRCLAWAYMNQGKFAESEAEIEKFRQLDDSPHHVDWLMLMGDLYTMSGRKEEARKLYVEVKRLAEQGYVDAGLLMWIHLHLGETDEVFAGLEKAFAQRSTTLTSIKVNRSFDALRSDPRFQDLVRRMKFPQ